LLGSILTPIKIALGDHTPEKAGVVVLRRIPDLGEESPLTSHLSQPLCDRLRVKPYTSADAERRNPACLRLLENRDSRDGQHVGEFVNARPIRSIRSGSDIGSAVLFGDYMIAYTSYVDLLPRQLPHWQDCDAIGEPGMDCWWSGSTLNLDLHAGEQAHTIW
jgi:hypothetical protein